MPFGVLPHNGDLSSTTSTPLNEQSRAHHPRHRPDSSICERSRSRAVSQGQPQCAAYLWPTSVLVDQMSPGTLKRKLQSCEMQTPTKSTVSIGRRGASLQFSE
eukprot:IDg13361t1